MIEQASILFANERLGGTTGPPRSLMLPLIVSVAIHAVALALALLIPLAKPAPELPEIVADFVIVVPLREAAMIQDLPPPMSPAAIDVLSSAHAGATLAPASVVADARTPEAPSPLRVMETAPDAPRAEAAPALQPAPPTAPLDQAPQNIAQVAAREMPTEGQVRELSPPAPTESGPAPLAQRPADLQVSTAVLSVASSDMRSVPEPSMHSPEPNVPPPATVASRSTEAVKAGPEDVPITVAAFALAAPLKPDAQTAPAPPAIFSAPLAGDTLSPTSVEVRGPATTRPVPPAAPHPAHTGQADLTATAPFSIGTVAEVPSASPELDVRQLPLAQHVAAASPATILPLPAGVAASLPAPENPGADIPPSGAGAADVAQGTALAALGNIPPLPAQAQEFSSQSAVEAVTTALKCARVNTSWETATGAMVLSGHLRSAEERRQLVKSLSGIPGVRRVVDAGLHIVGDPYCRLLNFLAAEGVTRSEDQRFDEAALGAPTQAAVVKLSAGMPLDLALVAPEFPSHVYVDYFTADGGVYHLLPAEKVNDNMFKPDEHFGIGAKYGRGRRATIGPPYGLDVVLALATSRPLALKPRPVAEPADRYLGILADEIRDARRRDPTVRVEYAYYLIYTSPERAAFERSP
ncbi:MAG TPA: DUF4384 domain-containing protein [Sphingomicrobium sp.]|nr:DUF4384 domain-containing protein [Sphingomicrobium sp.]